MSEFRGDLLVTPVNIKYVIKVIVIAVILVVAFVFSTFFFSLLWDSQRPPPSDQLSESEYEDAILVQFPFPYNSSDFSDALQDMFDGIIDDLDLSNFSQTLINNMNSDVEVFRVYDYNNFNEMRTKLWKYESFDEYSGDGWHSSAAKQIFDYYTYFNHSIHHPAQDIISIKMPLNPNPGLNSMVIPSLFPNPYIMEGSIYSNPNYIAGIPSLYKDDFNCTTLDIDFNPSTQGDVNMTYELFGLDLPTGAEIDAMAVEPIHTSPTIQSKYLQLKGDTLDVYISNNDDFAYYVNEINNTITSSDNAFIVADKIRSYLQYNFIKITDPSQYNPAPQGYDHVEWFLEKGIGYWADFTSAFCAFARVFGVPSRFVDGFNSFAIQEFNDTTQGLTGFPIKKPTFTINRSNMYTWAEIYVPTDTFGNGKWIQMDVYYDSYLGNPPTLGNYLLVLNTNFTAGYRGNTVNLTATLTLDGNPVDNELINFFDLTSFQSLGQSSTNINGEASLLVDIDDTSVVGPHNISAYFNPIVSDSIVYTVYGDIEVNFQNINPQEVNASIDTKTNIQGYVYDPIANTNVGETTLEIVVFYKSTSIKVPSQIFDTMSFDADPSGFFNIPINVINDSIDQYDVRLDTNGSWISVPFAFGFVNDSSNRMEFNVTRGIRKSVWFYINDVPSNIPDSPVTTRYSNIILKAKVVDEINSPLPNQNVQFYDYWSGIPIGANTTGANGIATYRYFVNNLMTTGPNLLFAKIGIEENRSYFILNEEPNINILSGPTPRIVNRTAVGARNTFFNIEGELLDDTTDRPIRNSIVSLKLLRGGIDESIYLVPNSPIWTDFNGYFNMWFEVAPNTPTGNYTLRLDFNGTINRFGIYPFSFDLPYINTSSVFSNELMVTTPTALTFNFWINGFPSDNYNQPIIPRSGFVNLSVYLESDGIPIGDGETIHFFDVTQNMLIGSTKTINGSTSLLYFTNSSTVAGPHQISARWGSNHNHSYFILNAPIVIDLISGPQPNSIYRTDTSPYIINLYGFVRDFDNWNPIKYARINVYLYQGSTPVNYLVLEGGFLQLDETGEFNLFFSVEDYTPEDNYTIRIEFAGDFNYFFPFNLFNEHYFSLPWISNFINTTVGLYELEVMDIENLDIFLSVEGNPTVPYYDDFYPPESYNYSETAHFQVNVVHSFSVAGRTVRIYDDYSNTLLDSYTYPTSNGFVQFDIPTNNLHAGLHKIRVEYHSFTTTNITYIIIDEPFTISATPNQDIIQRDIESFRISGLLNDGPDNMRFLRIRIRMFDSITDFDVTGLYLPQPYVIQVFNGNYQFDVSQIDISCPQGNYYLRIDFNGSIRVPFEVNLTDSLGHVSSPIIPITVTAGINLVGNTWYTDYDLIWPEFADQWIVNDTIHILGSLEWDNGTSIPFMFVNVTVKLLDGTIVAFNDTVQTDAAGNFHARIFIDQNNLLWPRYRVDSEIWVYFDPIFNGLQYVTSSEHQYF